jgi:hypothetical protein
VGNALLEAYAVGLIGAVAVFGVLFLVFRAVGNDVVSMVLTLTGSVAAFLVLAIGWNTLKKKL